MASMKLDTGIVLHFILTIRSPGRSHSRRENQYSPWTIADFLHNISRPLVPIPSAVSHIFDLLLLLLCMSEVRRVSDLLALIHSVAWGFAVTVLRRLDKSPSTVRDVQPMALNPTLYMPILHYNINILAFSLFLSCMQYDMISWYILLYNAVEFYTLYTLIYNKTLDFLN